MLFDILQLLCSKPFSVCTGLKSAKELIGQSSRRFMDARPVVVLITDGEWNKGKDPIYLINELKQMVC